MSDLPNFDDDFDLLLGDEPKTPLPAAPPWHVDSDACPYGMFHVGDPSEWIPCDCEDPASPWPPRSLVDGPKGCNCYFCMDKPQRDKGRNPCESYNHHCETCHSTAQCTALACKACER